MLGQHQLQLYVPGLLNGDIQCKVKREILGLLMMVLYGCTDNRLLTFKCLHAMQLDSDNSVRSEASFDEDPVFGNGDIPAEDVFLA